MMPRISSRRTCWASASAACHSRWSRAIGPGLTLAVALMQPAPPPRMFASRKVSLPAKTSKPPGAKASSIALVLLQSPELSFTPATIPG